MAGAVGDRYTVMGDAVNVAARLQAAGRPDSVTVGEPTYRASREAISYERLEPLRLKGKEEPVPPGRPTVCSPSPAARRGRAQTPLIGREEEAGLLMSLVERVEQEGRPHLVTVIGQAGVGKSRLLRELTTNLAESDDPPTIRRGQCPPYGAGHRLLGARRGAQRRVRDPRHRRARGRLGEAPRRRHRADEGAGGRGRRASATPRCSPFRSGSSRPRSCSPRRTTRSACARRSSPPPAPSSRRSPAAVLWSWRSTTSTGPTRECSI